MYRATPEESVDLALPRGTSIYERRKRRLPSGVTQPKTVVRMKICQGSSVIGFPASGPLTCGRRSMNAHRLSAGWKLRPSLSVSFGLKR
jgi:hypothetical protein